MIVPLFLDTNDSRHFSRQARQAVLASGLSAAELALVPTDEVLRMSGVR